MDYMKAYERCMNIARNKANGGEMSELEKENIMLGLDMDSREGVLNRTDCVDMSLGLGAKSRTISDKQVVWHNTHTHTLLTMASFRDRLSHVFKEGIMRRQYAMLLAMFICIVCIVGTIYVNRVELGLTEPKDEIVNDRSWWVCWAVFLALIKIYVMFRLKTGLTDSFV